MSNNRPDSIQDYFRKRGVKTQADTREPVSYVGRDAKTPFNTMAIRQATRFVGDDTDVAVLGEAYSSLVYEKGSNKERTYESVYGSVDYTVPVQTGATTREVLDEVFGNNDNDPTGDSGGISESGVKASVSAIGTTQNALRSLLEIHNALYQSQTLTGGERDEDTYGVRGIADVGAPIEPIA